MRLLRRAWRAGFARSDVPADGPFALDDARMLWTALMFSLPAVPFIVILNLSWALVPKNGFTNIATVVVALAASTATLFYLHHIMSVRVPALFATRRASIEGPALAAGWTYVAESPLPSPQTLEAVFHYSRGRLIPSSFTEVTSGSFNSHRFTAGHIAGTEAVETGERGQGAARSENLVLMSLPGMLPELKLRDRSASNIRDYGWSLAPVPLGDRNFDARWEVQTNFPEFAADLFSVDLFSADLFSAHPFSADLRAFLTALPIQPCTIVIRNGYISASRDPQATFESVGIRLAILAGFIERIPARVWQRKTTPQVAGIALRTGYRKRISGPAI